MGGVRGSSPSPRPSSVNAAQLPFRTPPLQPIHPGEAKKSGYLLEYLFGIVLRRTKDASLCFEAKPPFRREETITRNCLF